MILDQNRQARFLKDPVQRQLGNTAANLARIKSFSKNEANQQAVQDLLKESSFFIEWTAPGLDWQKQYFVRKLQRRLNRWLRHIVLWWPESKIRDSIGHEAGVWSNRLIQLAGYTNSRSKI
jgi:hypothetical protein